jgi:hypothetical protein
MKSLIIESKSTPEEIGYLDTIVIVDNDGISIVYHGPCSTCPNPYMPYNKKPWPQCYAWIGCTSFNMPLDWRCWNSHKHGKCILINDGFSVRTRYPNMNHGGDYLAEAIEIHMGYSKEWRGSAGCITYPPDIADIIDFFEIGETGKLGIVEFPKTKGILNG